MKSLGFYTMRGDITPTANTGTYGDEGDLTRILLFDGKFDTAFRVTKFEVWPADTTATADCSAILATDKAGLEDYDLGTQYASDVRQIAWSSANQVTSGVRDIGQSVIDRDNLVVQDLWIAGYNGSTGTKQVNYYIELEKFDITEWQGALSMVRNRAQG